MARVRRGPARWIVAACVAAIGATACSGEGRSAGAGDDGAADTTLADEQDAFLAYAACVREAGFDMPDPQVEGGDGNVIVRQQIGDDAFDPEDPEFKAADAACREEHLAGVVGGGDGGSISAADQQRMQEGALAFARCMREQGIDMPDPQFDEEGVMRFETAGDGSHAAADATTYGDAEKECRHFLEQIGDVAVVNG